jgi:uncharacterized protein YbaP (TraB family)
MTTALLPQGKTLKSIVGDALYADLDQHFQAYNSSIILFNSMNPMMVEVMLSMLELMPLFASGQPSLDEALLNQARQAGKEVGGVETVQEQLDALFNKTEKESVHALRATLTLLKERKKTRENIYKHALVCLFYRG